MTVTTATYLSLSLADESNAAIISLQLCLLLFLEVCCCYLHLGVTARMYTVCTLLQLLHKPLARFLVHALQFAISTSRKNKLAHNVYRMLYDF